MEQAINKLDKAFAAYHRAKTRGANLDKAADALADAAGAVLDSWDFDRGIPAM